MFTLSLIFAALAALATAQSAQPALNSTQNPFLPSAIHHNQSGLGIVRLGNANPIWIPAVPLTAQAKVDIRNRPTKTHPGTLRYLDQKDIANLQPHEIAVTSCDPKDYKGNIRLEDLTLAAIRARVGAVVFYTRQNDSYCELTDREKYGNFTSLYTLFAPPAGTRSFHPSVVISLAQARHKAQAAPWTYNGFEAFLDFLVSNAYGGTGSTAVAMIILYSITGVITALFLVIIVSGAVRAHRHPERYGPRGALGRPRQSRAKGIARAMLDTIPIVKFGENRQDAAKDVESHEFETRASQSPNGTRHDDSQINDNHDSNQNNAVSQVGTATTPASDSVNAAAAQPTAESSRTNSAAEPDSTVDNGLGCSICTDDFEIGQDIRVLPCNHKFHPACVDPWLLEVSGTCPLCRVNLHPNAQGDAENPTTDDLPPPLGAPLDPDSTAANAANNRRRSTLRAFVSSRLNRGPLQGTSAEERIEVLRRWREANAATAAQRQTSTSPTADSGNEEDETHRNRRLSAFSRLIRRRER